MNNQVAQVSEKAMAAAEPMVPAGYKQTEVGVIPEDWEALTIGSVTSWLSGGTPNRKNSEFWMGSIPWISGSTLKSLEISTSDQFLTEQGVDNGSKMAPLDSTLLLVRGSALHTEIRAGLVIAPVCFNQDVKALVPHSSVNPKYLTIYLLAMESELLKLVSSAGNSAGVLDTQLVQNFKFFQPPLLEQNAIANALSDVDALIGSLDALIAKKQAIKTATMQQLLTGRTRLPPFSKTESASQPDGSSKGYKTSELGEIPEDWEVIMLGQMAKFMKGAGLPKSDLVEDGCFPCVHYGQLFTTYGPKISNVISKTNLVGVVRSEDNDVLMPTSDVTPNGLATASCITEPGVVLGGDILVIRSRKEILDGTFFSYLITVMREQVMQLVTGSTVYHLYGSDMAKFSFALPPIEEQTAIATILSDMDEEIQALKARLTKTRDLKQGMMQQLLTGKIRLIKPLAGDEHHAG